MRFTSARQLKDWIKNKSKQTGVPANLLLQTYMMERLLERVSLSSYRDNLILKGGFLIAAMIGIDRRTTMDMDTTVKGLPVSREAVMTMLDEIISIDSKDGVSFNIQNMVNIHNVSEYDDYRVSLCATLHTIRVMLMNREKLVREDLRRAILIKAEERGSTSAIDNYAKHLRDIAESPEIAKIWEGYVKNYSYANGIELADNIALIEWVFES